MTKGQTKGVSGRYAIRAKQYSTVSLARRFNRGWGPVTPRAPTTASSTTITGCVLVTVGQTPATFESTVIAITTTAAGAAIGEAITAPADSEACFGLSRRLATTEWPGAPIKYAATIAGWVPIISPRSAPIRCDEATPTTKVDSAVAGCFIAAVPESGCWVPSPPSSLDGARSPSSAPS